MGMHYIVRKALQQSVLHPSLSLVSLSLALRLASSLLLLLLSLFLPTFPTDATQLSIPLSPYLHPFVRWDAVHFVHVALYGYAREEKTAAFGPGLTTGVMRAGGEAIAWLKGAEKVTADEVVLAGMLGTTVATTLASLFLYRLTQTLFSSSPRSFPLLTSTLFLLAPSRPTLHAAPYTEPFAALFTFAGMYFFSVAPLSSTDKRGRRKRLERTCGELAAAACWAAGSAFRAQGALLGLGFFGWRYILQHLFTLPIREQKLLTSLAPFLLLSTLSALPFLLFQRSIYHLYCSPSPTTASFAFDPVWDLHSLPRPRPWCDQGLGFSYGWIQREYWNIRPFAYWTPLQLPNFLLAAPVLALSFSASYTFYHSNSHIVLSSTLPFFFRPDAHTPSTSPTSRNPPTSLRPFSHPHPHHHPLSLPPLVPYVHLSTALSLLLLTTAHVQIALRVCVVDPVVWWRAAEIVLPLVHGGLEGEGGEGEGEGKGKEEGKEGKEGKEDRAKWGRWWVRYSIWWGTLSLVLWAAWLPPA
ncbi:hypothetical protein JCM11251_000098 [Rhodosporidiobolus azoricus]